MKCLVLVMSLYILIELNTFLFRKILIFVLLLCNVMFKSRKDPKDLIALIHPPPCNLKIF